MIFKDVAHLYKGVMMRTQMGDFPLMMYHDGNWWLDTIAYGLNAVEQDIKPLLRPLDSMTEEEVLTACKLACKSVYGDYRFSKWDVERSPYELCHWDVTNKRSGYSFTVSSIDGDVLLYDGEDIDPVYIDSNYRFWYLKQGFDLFSLIPNGEAIDKTKTTQNG